MWGCWWGCVRYLSRYYENTVLFPPLGPCLSLPTLEPFILHGMGWRGRLGLEQYFPKGTPGSRDGKGVICKTAGSMAIQVWIRQS